MGAALGYEFLGSSDTTELLQEPGTLAEHRWKRLGWSVPESTLAACWWLTNAPAQEGREAENCDFSARPRLLCKSLGVLRAELHQSQVATIPKVRAERQRRRDRNHATERLLQQNRAWQQFATAEQRSCRIRPSESSLLSLVA